MSRIAFLTLLLARSQRRAAEPIERRLRRRRVYFWIRSRRSTGTNSFASP